MRLYRRTVDNTVDMAVNRTTTTLSDKVKTHWSENKKIYAAVVGGVLTGAILSRHNQIIINIAPPTVQIVDDRPVVVAPPPVEEEA